MRLAKFFLCSNSDPPWWLAAIVHLHTREAFPFFSFFFTRDVRLTEEQRGCTSWNWSETTKEPVQQMILPIYTGGGSGGEGRSRARNRGWLLRCAHLCAVRGLSLCWDLNRSLPFIQWKLWLLVVGQNHVRYMLMLWSLSPETVNGCQLCFCYWLWVSKFIWRAPKRLLVLLIGILFFYPFTIKKMYY